MKGKHSIVVESDKLKYEFSIKRNITIIQGDSATGKTTLIDLLNTYARYGTSSGITIQADVPCVVYSGDSQLWAAAVDTYHDSIVFFDEDYSFIYTKEFAEKIQDTSNYYVLITRQPLYFLPYSIEEIYGIRTSGKYHYPRKIYHEFYQLYAEEKIENKKENDVILLVEDSKAGYQFYSSVCGKEKCISVGGNSGFVKAISEYKGKKKVLVIADGAAFGAYIAKVMAIAKQAKDVMMYFPESFEWVILKSGIIQLTDIKKILEAPEAYIDSKEYFSWERYFTELLIKSTSNDTVKKYDKSELKAFYCEGRNREEILKVLPEEIRKALD